LKTLAPIPLFAVRVSPISANWIRPHPDGWNLENRAGANLESANETVARYAIACGPAAIPTADRLTLSDARIASGWPRRNVALAPSGRSRTGTYARPSQPSWLSGYRGLDQLSANDVVVTIDNAKPCLVGLKLPERAIGILQDVRPSSPEYPQRLPGRQFSKARSFVLWTAP